MPVLIALAGIVGAIVFYLLRARSAARAVSDLSDMANDVRLAARRFGFRRTAAQHPVETLEDPSVAVAAIAAAYLELDDLPTREQQAALSAALERYTRLAPSEVEESLILGRWLTGQCGGASQAVPRLAKRLYKLGGVDWFLPLMEILKAVSAAGTGAPTSRQKSALEDLRLAFRIS